MEKEEKMDKTKKVEEVKETKKEKVEEPKFSKVSGKELKKDTKMNNIENKKEKKTHKENDGNERKGSKKIGYFIGGVLLLVVVLIIVTALLVLPSTPEKSFEGMLNSLKNADFVSVNKYVNYDEIVNVTETLQNLEVDEEAQSLLFNKLTWKILNISKEKDTASIEVEITNKDFDQIISNYTQEALRIAFRGESFTQEEQNNKLKEQLKNEDIGTKTVTVTIQLTKQGRDWKVQADESLVNALLPGLQEAINSLNSIING